MESLLLVPITRASTRENMIQTAEEVGIHSEWGSSPKEEFHVGSWGSCRGKPFQAKGTGIGSVGCVLILGRGIDMMRKIFIRLQSTGYSREGRGWSKGSHYN
jgi:hypothetical protein